MLGYDLTSAVMDVGNEMRFQELSYEPPDVILVKKFQEKTEKSKKKKRRKRPQRSNTTTSVPIEDAVEELEEEPYVDSARLDNEETEISIGHEEGTESIRNDIKARVGSVSFAIRTEESNYDPAVKIVEPKVLGDANRGLDSASRLKSDNSPPFDSDLYESADGLDERRDDSEKWHIISDSLEDPEGYEMYLEESDSDYEDGLEEVPDDA